MKKLEKAVSTRVEEVQELAEFLGQNGMTPFGALRTAVECVYGMVERYHRHNYAGLMDREERNDQTWQEAEKQINHS